MRLTCFICVERGCGREVQASKGRNVATDREVNRWDMDQLKSRAAKARGYNFDFRSGLLSTVYHAEHVPFSEYVPSVLLRIPRTK